MSQEPGSQAPALEQVVYFMIGEENYGLEVEKVQEIIRPLPVTRVPRAPVFIEGVINLRGNIISVIKMHDILGKKVEDKNDYTRVVIAHHQEITVGLLVDSVKGVIFLDSGVEEIAAAPTQFISGIGRLDGELVLLLDLASLLDAAGGLNKQEETG